MGLAQIAPRLPTFSWVWRTSSNVLQEFHWFGDISRRVGGPGVLLRGNGALRLRVGRASDALWALRLRVGRASDACRLSGCAFWAMWLLDSRLGGRPRGH